MNRLLRDLYYHQAWADGKPFLRTTVEDFKTNDELKEYAREFNTEAGLFLDEVPESRLQENIVIPWGPKPPQPITVELALTQAAMHSHHHRAQNAVRLHELGGAPPGGDFIAWLWKGRPEPDWR
jgi:uncharacterized damage-inducible protein DinB